MSEWIKTYVMPQQQWYKNIFPTNTDLHIWTQFVFIYWTYVQTDGIKLSPYMEIFHFRHFINKVKNNLQFTIERPVNKKLPFLHTCIKHRNSSFTITSYEKPSNTDLLMPAASFCPQKYKLTTLFILYDGAYKINQNFLDITKAWD